MTHIKTAEQRFIEDCEAMNLICVDQIDQIPYFKQEAVELRAALEQGQKENKQLRKLMCVKTSQSHYMDDGELQDNSEFPVIDFLRDTPEQIESAWKTRMIKKLEAQTPAQPIEPSNKLIFDTVSAREYLIENVITKFKDTTFTNYVRNQLAGDFAYQLAMFIQSAQPEPEQKLICKGSWKLGTACGKCERCLSTKPATQGG